MSRHTGLTVNGAVHKLHPFQVSQTRGGLTSQGKSVISAGHLLKNQEVSSTSKVARKIQKKTGVIAATTRGGSRMNITTRQDGGLYYRQLAAIHERASGQVTPGSRVPFEQARARLDATDNLKKGQTPPATKTLFSSHPFVGFTHPDSEFGGSQHTQVTAALQERFTRPDRHGMTPQIALKISRDPNDHRGPEAMRSVIPDDGGNKSMTTVRRPDGYSMDRVLQHPKRRTPGITQWNREYKKSGR